MKSRQPTKLSIPEPCNENWEQMSTVVQGRFCAACQKTVTDFTQMTDEEIILFIQENKSGCGRFLPEQLGRPLKPEVQRSYAMQPLYKKVAASLLFTVALIDRSFAQQKKIPAVQQTAGPKEAHTAIVLSGLLTDFQTQKPMPAETVLLKGGDWELQAKTNRWGGFTFHVPLRYQKEYAVLSLSTNEVKYVVPETKIALSRSHTDIRLWAYIPDALDTVKISMKVAAKVTLGGERAMVIKGGMSLSSWMWHLCPKKVSGNVSLIPLENGEKCNDEVFPVCFGF